MKLTYLGTAAAEAVPAIFCNCNIVIACVFANDFCKFFYHFINLRSCA